MPEPCPKTVPSVFSLGCKLLNFKSRDLLVWTQNPPGFGPWGFDSPSRHHDNTHSNKSLAVSAPPDYRFSLRRNIPANPRIPDPNSMMLPGSGVVAWLPLIVKDSPSPPCGVVCSASIVVPDAQSPILVPLCR